jgi:hypothetical protein
VAEGGVAEYKTGQRARLDGQDLYQSTEDNGTRMDSGGNERREAKAGSSKGSDHTDFTLCHKFVNDLTIFFLMSFMNNGYYKSIKKAGL